MRSGFRLRGVRRLSGNLLGDDILIQIKVRVVREKLILTEFKDPVVLPVQIRPFATSPGVSNRDGIVLSVNGQHGIGVVGC